MATPINILLVEDSEQDAELLLREIKRAGFQPEWNRVQTEADFLAGIKKQPDIIISDYAMPRFNGLQAAKLLAGSGLDIPFILVSGTVGEDIAVEAMKSGASDYLLKDRIVRLGNSIERALEQKRSRYERKEFEASLNLFRALLDRATDGIEVIDPETGRFLDVNETTCQRLGYSRDEMLSLKVPDVDVTGITDATWKSSVAEIRRAGFRIIQGRHKRKDGSTFPVEVNVRCVSLDRDYLIASVRDTTERKRTEGRLATHSTISRALADSNTLKDATPKIVQAICDSEGWDFGAIWEVDKKFNGLRCVEAWHRPEVPAQELAERSRDLTFGLNLGLPGRVWASGEPLLVPDLAQDTAHPPTPLIVNAGLRSAAAFPILLDGEVIGVMEFAGRETGKADEEMREMVAGVGRQIASFFKRTRAEEQFRQAQKLEGIGQLAGGVAHDFNNILAIVQMQADFLKSSGGLSAEQLEVSEEIIHTVERASALTRQLLLFSRREVFQPRDLELTESIANTTKMLNRVIGENVKMQFKFVPQPTFIHADPGMMDQVLLNLAVNARDAMPGGGQLVIEVSRVEFDHSASARPAQARPGSFVCLSVSDTGCGIPPEILPKIFEPFFTTKDVGQGTGLGLATVFGIVQQHQGWVDVSSEVGRGTTFQIYLPRLARGAESKVSSPAPTVMPVGFETILLVEDDPTLRASVRRTLRQTGYRILEAPTGVKALEVWKQNHDDIRLLVTDLVMPDGMTGKQLAERVLQDEPKMKVIYMSGYSAEVVGKDFPLKEGDNFLPKPFQAAKLVQTIRNKLNAVS